MKKILLTILLSAASMVAAAQIRNEHVYKFPERDAFYTRNELRLPDIAGYETLTGDFHIHTVFSDGKVWPDVRVNEAWRDGLDVIAVTDHLEYRPHGKKIEGDLNEPYRIAAKRGEQLGILVIPGCEITRQKPVGHINALFIEDANPMLCDEPQQAMDEARRQNAVVMLNHPGWPDDHFKLSDIQRRWFDEKRFHAIEIYNWLEAYPNAADLISERGVAYMSNSDIHQPIADRYGVGRGLRPMTILFCREHTLAGVREAIEASRTLAYFNGILVGRADLLTQFVKACLTWHPVCPAEGRYEITNTSELPFELLVGEACYDIAPNSTIRFTMKTPQPMMLKNCFTGRDRRLEIVW